MTPFTCFARAWRHLAYSFPDTFSYARYSIAEIPPMLMEGSGGARMTRAAGKAPLPFKMRGGAGVYALPREDLGVLG
jgi:hypothetical protein